jgi:hypothetical protein
VILTGNTIVVAVHLHTGAVLDEPGRLVTGMELPAARSAIALILVIALHRRRAGGLDVGYGGLLLFRFLNYGLLLRELRAVIRPVADHAKSGDEQDGGELAQDYLAALGRPACGRYGEMLPIALATYSSFSPTGAT